MTSYRAHLKIWRGDASGGDLEDFFVDVDEDEVVLDLKQAKNR